MTAVTTPPASVATTCQSDERNGGVGVAPDEDVGENTQRCYRTAETVRPTVRREPTPDESENRQASTATTTGGQESTTTATSETPGAERTGASGAATWGCAVDPSGRRHHPSSRHLGPERTLFDG